MTDCVHYISGFFAHPKAAGDVFEKLISQGLPRERVQIYSSQTVAPVHESTESSNKVVKDISVDGAIGTAVGTGIGALIEVAIISANVTLFVASPLIAPLALLGWGASIGGLGGAAIGAAENARPLSALIEDAITSGQIVIVAKALTEDETTVAREIIKDSIGDYKEVDASELNKV